MCMCQRLYSSLTIKIDVAKNPLHYSFIEPLEGLHTQRQGWTSNITNTPDLNDEDLGQEKGTLPYLNE